MGSIRLREISVEIFNYFDFKSSLLSAPIPVSFFLLLDYLEEHYCFWFFYRIKNRLLLKTYTCISKYS